MTFDAKETAEFTRSFKESSTERIAFPLPSFTPVKDAKKLVADAFIILNEPDIVPSASIAVVPVIPSSPWIT